MRGASAAEIATYLEDLAKQVRSVPPKKVIQKRLASRSGAASSSAQGAAPAADTATAAEVATRAAPMVMGQVPMEPYQEGMYQLSQVINHVPIPKQRPRKSVLLQGGDPIGILSEATALRLSTVAKVAVRQQGNHVHDAALGGAPC